MTKKNRSGLVIAGVIALFLILVFGTDLASLVALPDGMTFYDNFESGLRLDLWAVAGKILIYGEDLVVGSIKTCDQTYKNVYVPPCVSVAGAGCFECYGIESINTDVVQQDSVFSSGTISSTKLFTSEDIKFSYQAYFLSCQQGGYPQFSPQFTFGSNTHPLLVNPQNHDLPGDNCQAQSDTGVIEIRRYNDLDLTQYVVVIDGVQHSLGQNTEPAALAFSGGIINVNNVRWSPYFSCEIDYTTEVVVRDRFTSGSTVGLSTLTYTPKKFCPTDLGVLIFSEFGLTDEVGSISEAIARGEELVIPDGQYWQIDYITNYITNMSEQCGLGYAYDTTIRDCVSQVHQADVLQCISSNPIPQSYTIPFLGNPDACLQGLIGTGASSSCGTQGCFYSPTSWSHTMGESSCGVRFSMTDVKGDGIMGYKLKVGNSCNTENVWASNAPGSGGCPSVVSTTINDLNPGQTYYFTIEQGGDRLLCGSDPQIAVTEILCGDIPSSNCPIPCQGLSAECIDNTCTYSGECLGPPIPGQSIWSMIQSLWTNFWNWILSLFS